MKIFGIDYGSKFTGIAFATEDRVAFPYKIIKTNELEDFLLKEVIGQANLVVMGESLNLKGEHNKIHEEILKLKNYLESKGVKVVLFDERYTSSITFSFKRMLDKKVKTRKAKKNTRVDDKSAAVILQNYLDKSGS